MSEPTFTLQQLRRAIGRELEMPFFRKYKSGFLAADSGSVSTLVDSDLAQKDKVWVNAWVYRIASQEVSQILNFDANTNQLTFEVPVTAFAASDQYEIHSIWNAYDIHEAINQAIRDSRRVFIETRSDTTMIVEENKLSHGLTMSPVPFMIHKVWLEQPASVKRGTLISATATTFNVDASVLSDVEADGTWSISIYAGTGTGQRRGIIGIAGGQGTVAAWTETPNNTSKFAIWDNQSEINDWYPWHAIRYDSTKEFPDILYFSRRPIDFLGLRIRLEYSAYPGELFNETDPTIIPISYLMPAAISILHGRKVKDTKTDRELHFAEAKRYQEKAEAWLVRNAPHKPDNNILSQSIEGYQPSSFDPLNWQG